MKIDILTLFPEIFAGVFDFSIVKRAVDKQLVTINLHNLRNWATDKYKSVDDRPYGGGAGMILRVDIVDKALTEIKPDKTILLDAAGDTWTQQKAGTMINNHHIALICGHYEGVDYRIAEHLADEVISVGNYVLSGGEIGAMALVDSMVRLIPGVLGNPQSLEEESFDEAGLEYPQYTRPEDYKSWKVPEILLSGHHQKIKAWRKAGRQSGE